MSSLPSPAPAHCPGPESVQAGKEASCQGCPNQAICSSAEAKLPDPDFDLIRENLQDVQVPIVVISGKGGVGKSAFASQLAYCLAMSDDMQHQVGCLDLDICGPSIPIMMKHGFQIHSDTINGEDLESNNISLPVVHISGTGWSPIMIEDNLSVMSVGYLLESEENAVIWRSNKKNELIKKFLKNVDWGYLDYLIIDTPPGTSDEHLSLTAFLKYHPLLSAVIITTPQEVSLQDVRKEIDFCRKLNLPLLGVVENMSSFECPQCHNSYEIFPPTSGGARSMANHLNLPFLGSLPLDPAIGKACDQGKSFMPQSIFQTADNKTSFNSCGQTVNMFMQIVANLKRNISNLKREQSRIN